MAARPRAHPPAGIRMPLTVSDASHRTKALCWCACNHKSTPCPLPLACTPSVKSSCPYENHHRRAASLIVHSCTTSTIYRLRLQRPQAFYLRSQAYPFSILLDIRWWHAIGNIVRISKKTAACRWLTRTAVAGHARRLVTTLNVHLLQMALIAI